tara:strand:- start:461 stop:1495 length:1035 start_codon:yes stop_codon:yes gene_type:complete
MTPFKKKSKFETLFGWWVVEKQRMSLLKINDAMVASEKDKVIKTQTWGQRKSLWWLLWLEANDIDAYEILMKEIHRHLMFDDVKLKFICGYHKGEWDPVTQKHDAPNYRRPIWFEGKVSMDHALEGRKYGLMMRHRAEVGGGRPVRFVGFVPDDTSVALDRTHENYQNDSTDNMNPHSLRKITMSHMWGGRLSMALNDCGRFNPSNQIRDEALDEVLNRNDIPLETNRIGMTEEFNWTRWQDNFKWDGVNFCGLRYNPKPNVKTYNFVGGPAPHHARNHWRDNEVCPAGFGAAGGSGHWMRETKKELLKMAEESGVSVKKSWKKGKIVKAMLKFPVPPKYWEDV